MFPFQIDAMFSEQGVLKGQIELVFGFSFDKKGFKCPYIFMNFISSEIPTLGNQKQLKSGSETKIRIIYV